MRALGVRAQRGLALVDTRWATLGVFVISLGVWWLQAIAIPLARGRDFGTYLGAYVELFQRDPIDLGYVLGRTPIAPLVTGGLLDFADGALAEPAVSVVYALSIAAWFVTARRFGAVTAVVVTAGVLVYPSYGILFHELASDSLFAAAFAGWSAVAVRAMLDPTPARFALVGAGIAALVLVRPGSQAMLALSVLPLVLAIPWRSRLVCSATLAGSAVALLGLWAVHNGVLYGTYTVATGANSRLPFERAYLTDRIVRPENGPASRRLAELVSRRLLTEEPYRSYGITLEDVFENPSPRMIVDLTSLSNRTYGWKSDGRILRSVGIEAVRTHPARYARGVTKTTLGLLWRPVFRPLPSAVSSPDDGDATSPDGEVIVVNGKRLPKPSEGESIPAPHDQAPTTARGGIDTVWTSPSEAHLVFGNERDRVRLAALYARMSELAANLPDRPGNSTLALRLNQASRWWPAPLVWLLVGLVGLVVRRPRGALAATTPAIGGSVVILLSALAIDVVPHYSVPVAPAFTLLGAAAWFGARRSATGEPPRPSAADAT